MKTDSTPRIFGLDLLRTVAIVLVVLTHSNFRFIQDALILPLPDGVDLFFVLSGYLVGTLLIKTAEQHQQFNQGTVLHFLKRRWFRTLPNYFLFLLINIVLIYFGLIPGFLNKYLLTFLVFFQNFYKPFDFLYWESWSLSVEEWFYLLFPLTVLLILRLSKHRLKTKNALLVAVCLFLIVPLLFRFFQYQANPGLDFDLYFRKLVLTRLDTIGFGLAGAYLHWYLPAFWHKTRNATFLSGCFLLLLSFYTDIQNPFVLKVVGSSINGLAILLLLPKLESLKTERLPLKPIRGISKISYSMYLIHLPLIHLIHTFFIPSTSVEAWSLYAVFWLVLFILSALVYRFYEKPLTDLRNRRAG